MSKIFGSKHPHWTDIECPVCGYYCLGRGGNGCIDKPSLQHTAEPDMVNRPPHYNSHPSGIEQIEISEHMNFCLGNAHKYIWRAGLKGDAIEDLKKAQYYLNREIERLEKING